MEPDTLSGGQILIRLSVVLLLVLANGFFVAAEFALVASRRTRLDALVRAGSRRARMARRATEHLDQYLSSTQLGITIASIGLGFVGEATVATALMQVFSQLPPPLNVLAAHGIAVIVAFVAITLLQIVLGELAPKSLAILKPETIALWTALPLAVFTRIFGPFIWTLNGLANLLLRAFGMRPPHAAERVHRPEEIEMLVAQSHEHGLLAGEPVKMIRGVFDLSETTAGEIMTPRTDVVALPEDSTVDQATELILEEGHSRIPVYRESLDQIVGVLLARDVWRAQQVGQNSIADLIRPLPFVPDSKPLESLLREMQEERVHMVAVVDEFGGTAGIVTLEDVVEEVVGEIRDEHEALESPAIVETDGGPIYVDGAVSLTELNERYDLHLPEDDYTTIGGYVMGRLGRVPRDGESVAFEKGRMQVVAMDGRRIQRVALLLERVPSPDEDFEGSE
jgi:magnesium and cobalt exporter, CNNM family